MPGSVENTSHSMPSSPHMVTKTCFRFFALQAFMHASVHANGDVAVLMTNTNKNVDANVTLNIAGGNIGCVGTRYAYTPVNTDQDGGLTGDWIYANSAGTGFTVLVPKFSSVVARKMSAISPCFSIPQDSATFLARIAVPSLPPVAGGLEAPPQAASNERAITRRVMPRRLLQG